jgi:hypothetical protein
MCTGSNHNHEHAELPAFSHQGYVSRVKKRTEIAVCLGLGLLLALVVHKSLLGALGSALPGESGSDIFRAHWTAWLVAEELPGWPFSTGSVGFPGGSHLLPFPAVSLVALSPLTWIVGADISLPLLIVLYTALAFAGTWLLVRTLGGGPGGGALAGALFATQPILAGSLFDGTVEMLAVAWLPLFMTALFRAIHGNVRWGVASGVIFIAICLESVYLGSFSALAALVILTQIRSKEGFKAAGFSALAVVVGMGVVALLFWPVLSNIGNAMATSGDDLDRIRKANAVDFSGLWYMAKFPGAKGWIVGDIYAPPMAHWVVFALLGLAAIHRSHWIVALGALYLLLATHSDLLAFWSESPIGEVVRFPRRYLIGVGLCFSTAAGMGLLHLKRWPKVEMGVGVVLGAYMAWWGSVAGGLAQAYPLTELPGQPAFAAWIAQDNESVNVLLLPQQLPLEQANNAETGAGEPENLRVCMPVFAQLAPEDSLGPCRSERSRIASSDHVWLQTQFDQGAWFAPSLVTLVRNKQPNTFEKNLTDLARGKMGMSLPHSATAKPESYTAEVDWLRGEGLKYVAVDVDRFRESELIQLDKVLSHFAVETRDFPDGTGVRVYRLYEERPEISDTPKDEFSNPSPVGYSGRVVNAGPANGVVSLLLEKDGEKTTCFTRPEDGSFHCPVDEPDQVWLRINQSLYTVERTDNGNGSESLRALKAVP